MTNMNAKKFRTSLNEMVDFKVRLKTSDTVDFYCINFFSHQYFHPSFKRNYPISHTYMHINGILSSSQSGSTSVTHTHTHARTHAQIQYLSLSPPSLSLSLTHTHTHTKSHTHTHTHSLYSPPYVQLGSGSSCPSTFAVSSR